MTENLDPVTALRFIQQATQQRRKRFECWVNDVATEGLESTEEAEMALPGEATPGQREEVVELPGQLQHVHRWTWIGTDGTGCLHRCKCGASRTFPHHTRN